MAQTSASSSPLIALAARWRVLSVMAVMFARHICLLDKMRAAGARDAALLEAFLYRAIIQISRDISMHSADKAALTDEEREALQYLDIAYTYLMVLALLMRQMRADFESADEARRAILGGWIICSTAMPSPIMQPTPAIDSS